MQKDGYSWWYSQQFWPWHTYLSDCHGQRQSLLQETWKTLSRNELPDPRHCAWWSCASLGDYAFQTLNWSECFSTEMKPWDKEEHLWKNLEAENQPSSQSPQRQHELFLVDSSFRYTMLLHIPNRIELGMWRSLCEHHCQYQHQYLYCFHVAKVIRLSSTTRKKLPLPYNI